MIPHEKNATRKRGSGRELDQLWTLYGDVATTMRRLIRELAPPYSLAYLNLRLASKTLPNDRFRQTVSRILRVPEAKLFNLEEEAHDDD